ncbi:MAG: methyltransferase domain-containing protein [Candidatus Lernaella stagnicola]|nr:methyltransferase domain-containing protein [Candidatus Lernaella stagnicola]
MMRRLADRLGLDLSYYLSGGSLLLVDQAMMMAAGFATTWCFSNYAPKSFYGGWGYIMAIVGTLSLIALPGVSQAIQRSAARGHDGALAVGMRRRMKAGTIASGLLVVVAAVLYLVGKPSLAKGAMVAAVMFPIAYAMDDYRSVLFGKQRFGMYVVVHSGIQCAVATATILAIATQQPFPLILLANMATRGVGNYIGLTAVKRRVLRNEEVDHDFHSFGWNLSLVGIVGGISYHLDRIIVGATLGLTTMAAYELAFRLSEPIRSLGVFLNKLVFPRAVKVSGAAVATRFLMRLGPMVLLLAVAGVAGTVLVDPFMRVVFPKYPETIPLAKWMIWSALISVALIYLETFYLSQERFHRTFYLASLLRPLAIIIMLPFFIVRWGVYGAIWTKLIVRLAESVLLGIKLLYDRGKLRREEAAGRSSQETLGPLETIRCPLCGEPDGELMWRVPDRLHGLPGRFSVVRCPGCGLWRQQPRVTPGAIGAYYPEDYAVYGSERPPATGRGRTFALRERWLRRQLDGRPGPGQAGWGRTLRDLPARLFGLTVAARFNPLAVAGQGRRLLDVGCASGDFLLEMQAHGWRVAGVEFDAAAAERARSRGLEVVTGTFPEAAGQLTGRYHAVTIRHVIEHLPDPMAALRAARELLTPDGVLLVTTPLADGLLPHLAGEYWYPLDQPRHYHLFGRENLAGALRAAGFRVTAVLNVSSTTSWTRSFAYFAADGRWAKAARRLDEKRWVHLLVRPLVRLLDLFGCGDGGVLLAVRDDAPFAGYAPREIREKRVL